MAAWSTSQRWTLLPAAMIFLAGCVDEGNSVPLPSAADSPRDPSSPSSDIEMIKRSYVAFIGALDRADSLPPNMRREQLAIHMTDPQLTRVIDRVQAMNKEGITSYGRAVPHVQHIAVTGGDATVSDCQDSSHAGIFNTLTGKKMNRGVKEEGITAFLSKGTDGRWRVTKTISHGKGC